MDTEQFVLRYGIHAGVEWTDTNPNMAGSQNMNHFKVELRRYHPNKRFTVPFSQGYGISGEPTAADVLDCLASDAGGIEQGNGDFESWAGEYGYDTDSRRAERTYRACVRQREQLERFLGAELFRELLWDTERL